MTDHEQRKAENHWTADQVKEMLEDRFSEIDKRYQQRWEAQEEALKKVNEIRDVVADIRKDTMLRIEVEQRFASMMEMIRETQRNAEKQTEQHFSSNRSRIEACDTKMSAMQNEITALNTIVAQKDTGSQQIWQKFAILISVLIAAAALVSAFWRK